MITLIFAGWYGMTVMRRELPGSTWREFETEVIYRIVAPRVLLSRSADQISVSAWPR
jgi:hypothetical protein